MKITKKRVAIATAAAALVTAGIFGGTYAKYHTETLPTTDSARLAKFYLKSDNTLDLFDTQYDNQTGTPEADVKNDKGDYNLIAPNVKTAQDLYFTVETEVKSKLTFSGLEIDTNLPDSLCDYIIISIGNSSSPEQYTLTQLKNSSVVPVPEYEVTVIQAGKTITAPVPVTLMWGLETLNDATETEAAIKQALGSAPDGGYYLNLTGHATLTQID